MAVDTQTKQEVVEAIKAHLKDQGESRFDLVLARFKGRISKATFYRIVDAEVRVARASLGAIKEASLRLRKVARELPPVPAPTEPSLPPMESAPLPSPAVVASYGRHAGVILDVLGNLCDCMSDAIALRDLSIDKNDDGSIKKIKNPMLLERSISRRLAIGEDYMTYQERAFESEKQRSLWREVLHAIGEADPGTQARILERLRDLNATRGISAHALIA